MSDKKPKGQNKHPGRGGNNISLAPLTVDEAVDAMFAVKPDDVKRIVGSKPGNRKPKG
ncbi:MAG TPA: hypothetical protein VK324_07220 [Tepidisphaeraceae bacterium]|nr:hypothetical protein [Tepidisphaeraceae bacterium]